jgi:GT2 family glycosyltransferase
VKIACIGHSYHLMTRSNDFFLELLARCGEVDMFVDSTWEDPAGGGAWAADFRQEDYDCIVVYQAHEAFAHLDTGHPNLVFVPMYDAMRLQGELYWQEAFGRAKVLCFSAALYRETAPFAPLRHFAQYFPEPRDRAVIHRESEAPSAFFWYRRPPVTPALLARLVGDLELDRFTLHWAPDPVGDHDSADPRLPRARRVERTSWFPDRASYLARLAEHDVFFAPRLYEGIGLGFLEAMAMGLCVVAPALPTHDEYIHHGADGLLYAPDAPVALSLERWRELGRRAHERVARGRELWERAEGDVREFVATPRAHLDRRPAIVDFFRRAQSPPPANEPPRVSVVTVCLDAAAALERTLASVFEQDYPALEYVVIDGGSTDGTLELLARHAERIDFWKSRPDQRAYTSMMDALAHVTGEYVLFLNAGDVLTSPGALSALFARTPRDADVVCGDHVYLRHDGVDELRPAADFDSTGEILERGGVDRGWLERIPCHQAVAVRAPLLREHGFDPAFRIAADHDLYFRLRLAGARFYTCGEMVAIYRGGGASERFFDLCLEEWQRIAARHGRAGPARRLYADAFGLAPRSAWVATLRGWGDRLGGRRRRRFGREFVSAGSPVDFGERPRVLRGLDPLVALAGILLARLSPPGSRSSGAGRDLSSAGDVEVYRARLDEGIDFRRAGRPGFVARWSGFSFREPWGRWSEGERVEIHFSKPLPKRFELVFEACAIGDNTRRPIRVSAGEALREVRVPHEPMDEPATTPSVAPPDPEQSPFRPIAVEFETSGDASVLAFEIPRPTSPAERWPAASADRRPLGIAFQTLRIERR